MAPLIAILLLAGCSKERDVAYYQDNPAERGERVSECDMYNDASADCDNARKAQTAFYAEQTREYAEKAKARAKEAGTEAVAAAIK